MPWLWSGDVTSTGPARSVSNQHCSEAWALVPDNVEGVVFVDVIEGERDFAADIFLAASKASVQLQQLPHHGLSVLTRFNTFFSGLGQGCLEIAPCEIK